VRGAESIIENASGDPDSASKRKRRPAAGEVSLLAAKSDIGDFGGQGICALPHSRTYQPLRQARA